MTLPGKSNRPEYRLTLPISKKKVGFYPFDMRSERALALASQTGDDEEVIINMCNVITDCITTGDIKAEELPVAELELLFMNMRQRAVGDKVDIVVQDPDQENYPEVTYQHTVDLSKLEIQGLEDYSPLRTLEDGTIVKWRLPGYKDMASAAGIKDEIELAIHLLKCCIVSITEGDETVSAADITPEELEDWMMTLGRGDFATLATFIGSIPQMAVTFKKKRADGTFASIELAGLANFRQAIDDAS